VGYFGRVLSFVGYTAAALTSVAFLPQLIRTWRTRSTADLSLGTLAAQTSGVGLWILYGVGIGSTPVILSNVLTFALTATLLVLKLSRR
jgi:MtN3 and saliva related transmembrane protein